MNAVAPIRNEIQSVYDRQAGHSSQLRTFYDEKYKAGWFLMHGQPRPCFTEELLGDISNYFTEVRADIAEGATEKYDFLVLASDVEGTFNLGGDLDRFSSLIQTGDYDALLSYALLCVDVLYNNMMHLGENLISIALVKGDALGGGFESALSSNVLIAERGVKMGLPEVLFNLFPGMGAFSLLSRKVGARLAEDMIMSGQLYDAESLHQMGVVDILAEPGQGELAVYQFMHKVNKNKNSYRAMAKVKDYCNPISYAELVDVTKIWVESALKLGDRDLRMMRRLVQRQSVRTMR